MMTSSNGNIFPRYWPFVRGIRRSNVNSPHKGQWRGALVFSLICTQINGRVNNREAGDLRCHRAHYNVTVMHTQGIHWLGTNTVENVPWFDVDMTHANLVKINKNGGMVQSMFCAPLTFRSSYIIHKTIAMLLCCSFCDQYGFRRQIWFMVSDLVVLYRQYEIDKNTPKNFLMAIQAEFTLQKSVMEFELCHCCVCECFSTNKDIRPSTRTEPTAIYFSSILMTLLMTFCDFRMTK